MIIRHKNLSDIVIDFFVWAILIILCFICVYPVLYVLFASLSNPGKFLYHTGALWAPLTPMTLEGYSYVLKDPYTRNGYLNTIFYVSVGTIYNMIMTSLGAYFLSRRNVLFKKFIMLMVTVTMFFGGGLIPFFLTVRDLGMYDKWPSVIIPFAINTWNMIILRTGFQSVPVGLEESALIDGANQWTIFLRIVLPTSKAVLSVILLYYLVGNWNNWFWPMVFLRERSKFPVQVILREILIANDTRELYQASGNSLDQTTSYQQLVKYVTIIISTVPMMCVYPFIQKYFVKGVFVGSLKG